MQRTILLVTVLHKCASGSKEKNNMLNFIRARQERRPIILEGISRGLKQSEIAAQLRVNRWVIKNDIKFMRNNGDPELKKAQEAQEQIRAITQARISNEIFLNMTGMTFQEKSFRNMIDYNKRALLKILRSEDQNSAIMKLSKNIRKTMRRNGIITKRWKDNEITERAQEYLTIKNRSIGSSNRIE